MRILNTAELRSCFRKYFESYDKSLKQKVYAVGMPCPKFFNKKYKAMKLSSHCRITKEVLYEKC